MKETAKKRKNKELNKDLCTGNGGFSLVEVLVAIVIIAIVAIPVLRAFVTSANTTAKSKMKMRATSAAENIMEDLVALNVEQAVRKYGLGAVTEPNELGHNGDSEIVKSGKKEAYRLNLSKDSINPAFDKDVREALEDDYQAEIFIDPSYYSNSNGLNVSNFDILSSDIAAIFSMTPQLNDKAYNAFETRNQEYYDANYEEGSWPPLWSAQDFKDLGLLREIRVDIEKTGVITNADGESYPKVTVTVTVSYLLKENVNTKMSPNKLVDDSQVSYIALNRQIFSNAVSEKKLASIFIMYYPLYEMAKNEGDIITVHNHDDVEADLYIVAQDVYKDADSFKSYRSDKKGLILNIYEDEVTDELSGEKVQPLRLRTNLIDEESVAYVSLTKSEDDVVPIQCFLKVNKSSADKTDIGDPFDLKCWNNIKGAKGNFEDKKVTKSLRGGALDGKTLDESTIENRIYDVTVRVWKKPSDESYTGTSYDDFQNYMKVSGEWPVSVELTGSMLQKGE